MIGLAAVASQRPRCSGSIFNLALFCLSAISLSSFGQELPITLDKRSETDGSEGESVVVVKSKRENRLRSKEPYRFMANFHGGVGINRFFGDVIDRDNVAIHTLGNRPLFAFGIGLSLNNFLDLHFDGMYGGLSGSENFFGANRNFEADIHGAGIAFIYNFRNFFRNPVGLTPFLSVGASYSGINVRSDLMDRNGEKYHYWDDGLIRNVSQTFTGSSDIVILERDFNYETPVSLGQITTVSFPVGAGLDFNVSRKFTVRLGAAFYFTADDNIDGVVSGEDGAFGMDSWLTTSLAFVFRFDPFKKRQLPLDIDFTKYERLPEIKNGDSDGDGVKDFLDQCSGTLKGIPVDKRGCPLDRDNDGIPDYRDDEQNTPLGSLVDAQGVTLDYDDVQRRFVQDSASMPHSKASLSYVFSKKEKNPVYTVHVGTFVHDDIPIQLKKRLSEMPGVVERRIHDSTTVFTVGVFKEFAHAAAKQNELRAQGMVDAFGATDRTVQTVAPELRALYSGQSYYEYADSASVKEGDVLTYGVELKGFRLRIELDRLSRLIAKYGVEMKVAADDKKITYVIGNSVTFDEAFRIQSEVMSLGVKNSEITAKLNNRPLEIDKARELEKILLGR